MTTLFVGLPVRFFNSSSLEALRHSGFFTSDSCYPEDVSKQNRFPRRNNMAMRLSLLKNLLYHAQPHFLRQQFDRLYSIVLEFNFKIPLIWQKILISGKNSQKAVKKSIKEIDLRIRTVNIAIVGKNLTFLLKNSRKIH